MWTVLWVSLVAASGSGPSLPRPIQLAVTDFTGARVEKAELQLYAEHLSTQLGGRGLQVVTSKQIASALGFERQRQLMGCSTEGESCLAELASALGADGLVTGEIARLDGGEYQVNLKVVDAATARALSSYSGRASSRQGVVDSLLFAARKFSEDLAVRFNRVLPAPTQAVVEAEEAARRPLRGAAWIPAVTSGALLATSGTLFLFSRQRYETLVNATGTLPAVEARRLRDEGSQLQLFAATAAAGAAVSAAVSLGFFVWRVEPGAPQITAVSAGPAGVSISGVFQ